MPVGVSIIVPVGEQMSKRSSPIVDYCYLCSKKLGSLTTPDHIIPDKLFIKEDSHRPKLPVHHECNNSKSKDDEWFIRQLQIRASFNPEAEQEIKKLMDKAISEKPDAYIIGKKLRNYKLARGIFDKISWGLELRHNGQDIMQMRLQKEDVLRFQRYIETMCRGLFILNIPLANPTNPELLLKQYAYLELKGKDGVFIKAVKDLIDKSEASKFGQQWGGRISYIGSRVTETPDKGFIFVQFYTQFGILAVFK